MISGIQLVENLKKPNTQFRVKLCRKHLSGSCFHAEECTDIHFIVGEEALLGHEVVPQEIIDFAFDEERNKTGYPEARQNIYWCDPEPCPPSTPSASFLSASTSQSSPFSQEGHSDTPEDEDQALAEAIRLSLAIKAREEAMSSLSDQRLFPTQSPISNSDRNAFALDKALAELLQVEFDSMDLILAQNSEAVNTLHRQLKEYQNKIEKFQKKLEKRSTCIICHDDVVTAGFQHSNSIHICVCGDCGSKHLELADNSPLCPVCKQPIEKLITQLYFNGANDADNESEVEDD